MQPKDRHLEDLARYLNDTAEDEIDCAEMLKRVAAYFKALTDRDELTKDLQQVAQHLKVCPECVEEFEALIRAEGLDPSKVLGS